MSRNGITCELVDQEDLDTRYLAGQLSPEGAEAFEEHFFGCERCWDLVQQGLALRSAFGPDAAAPQLTRPASVPRKAYGGWWSLAAAAGIAFVAVGVWRSGHLSDPTQPEDVLRGTGTAFVVIANANDAALAAAWPRLAQADVYRVRLYRADGMTAVERETSDTSISVPVDSLGGLGTGSGMFWQVQAFDRLRNPVARSELTRVVLPSP